MPVSGKGKGMTRTAPKAFSSFENRPADHGELRVRLNGVAGPSSDWLEVDTLGCWGKRILRNADGTKHLDDDGCEVHETIHGAFELSYPPPFPGDAEVGRDRNMFTTRRRSLVFRATTTTSSANTSTASIMAARADAGAAEAQTAEAEAKYELEVRGYIRTTFYTLMDCVNAGYAAENISIGLIREHMLKDVPSREAAGSIVRQLMSLGSNAEYASRRKVDPRDYDRQVHIHVESPRQMGKTMRDTIHTMAARMERDKNTVIKAALERGAKVNEIHDEVQITEPGNDMVRTRGA